MTKKLLASAVVAALLVLGTLFALPFRDDAVLGSAVVGNDYQYRQITTSNASTTPLVLKTGGGSLGSVVITVPASAGNLKFYNSASTTATTSSELMLGFTAAADVAGTYTFDSEFSTGLQLDVPVGFDGQYTVTWR